MENFIPHIIGDTGFIVSKREISVLKNVLNKAINSKNKSELGKKARDRIVDQFNSDIREKALIEIIEGQ